MKTVKITLAILGVFFTAILAFVLYANQGSNEDFIESYFSKIETDCNLMTESTVGLAGNLVKESECIQERLVSLTTTIDPEDIALVAFRLYGSEEFPVLTRNCHPAVHVLGSAKAQSGNTTFKNPLESLHGCSTSFLHGYSEYPVSLLEGEDLIENGFQVCADQIPGQEHKINCAHTYGHYIYRKIDTQRTPESAGRLLTYCEELGEEFAEICVWGVFMDYFSIDENYEKLTNNGQNINTNHILRPCFVNDTDSIRQWCVMMSWEVLYKAAQSEGGTGDEIYERFQKKCHDLEEKYHFYCGMTLSYPITRQYAGSIQKNLDECVKAGHGNQIITSGCLTWGAKLLWRHHRDFEYFEKICLNENNIRRGACFEDKLSASAIVMG